MQPFIPSFPRNTHQFSKGLVLMKKALFELWRIGVIDKFICMFDLYFEYLITR